MFCRNRITGNMGFLLPKLHQELLLLTAVILLVGISGCCACEQEEGLVGVEEIYKDNLEYPAIAATDFNMDGYTDVVFGDGRKICLLCGIGDGQVAKEPIKLCQINTDSSERYINIADMNSDGLPDIIIGHRTGIITIDNKTIVDKMPTSAIALDNEVQEVLGK